MTRVNSFERGHLWNLVCFLILHFCFLGGHHMALLVQTHVEYISLSPRKHITLQVSLCVKCITPECVEAN